MTAVRRWRLLLCAAALAAAVTTALVKRGQLAAALAGGGVPITVQRHDSGISVQGGDAAPSARDDWHDDEGAL
ncbi:MAG TPA: hypothetical protein PKM88_03020 [bacterium]|nr:hypothetical protein [bacterium]